MVDRNFNLDDLKLKNLVYELKDGKIEDVYEFLRLCVEKGISELPPDVSIQFFKLLSNLHSNGFTLSTNVIKILPKDVVIEELKKVRERLKAKEEFEKQKKENPYIDGTKHIDDKEIERIKELVQVDTSIFEEERINIRKTLMGDNFKVRIKLGKKFSFSSNKDMSIIDIVIPQDYDIEIEEKFLLFLQEKYKVKLVKQELEKVDNKKDENKSGKKGETIKTIIGENVEKKVELPLQIVEEDINFKDFLRKQKLDRTKPFVLTAKDEQESSQLHKLLEELDKQKDKIKDKPIAIVLDSAIPNIEHIKKKIRNSELKFFGVILTDQVQNEDIKEQVREYVQKLIDENPNITQEELNKKVEEYIKELRNSSKNEEFQTQNDIKPRKGKKSFIKKLQNSEEFIKHEVERYKG
jgi:hypothetical protein